MILRLLAGAARQVRGFRSTRWTTDLLNGLCSYTAFSSTPPPMKCKRKCFLDRGDNLGASNATGYVKAARASAALANTTVQRIKIVIPYRNLNAAATIVELEGISCVLSVVVVTPRWPRGNAASQSAPQQAVPQGAARNNDNEAAGRVVKKMLNSAPEISGGPEERALRVPLPRFRHRTRLAIWDGFVSIAYALLPRE